MTSSSTRVPSRSTCQPPLVGIPHGTGSGAASPQQVNKGLLRYNGCVRGTNTPNCRTYPNKVKTYVEREAQSLCGDKSFYDCIAKPVMVGLLDGLPGR